MMRALITGGNGFVGQYLARELYLREWNVSVAGQGELAAADHTFDLGDASSVLAMFREETAPDVVFHLAAHSSVADAVRQPLQTYDANILGTARVVEALRARAPQARLVFVSSAEVYGAYSASEMPLRETTLPSPVTLYAASKLAAETIVLASARTYGLRALVVRPFNLIGPGQSDGFVAGAFAHRLAAIAAGGPALFPVGNLTAQRDFLDVRDASRALADLAEYGADGNVYNLCSGTPTRISDVLRQLVFASRIGVEIREDPSLMRPVDVPLAYGDNAKLRAATGWAPSIPLGQTLRETYAAALAEHRADPLTESRRG